MPPIITKQVDISELIDFGVYLVGHSEAEVQKMYNEWKRYKDVMGKDRRKFIYGCTSNDPIGCVELE